ncbi:MAG: AAA family ATPase [Dehalococcoidales bacterium]|nr:AAA family ATPase [Dehalococcoidales bacterium]
MKIAISGKGGVGKTLLAAYLSSMFARDGYSVLAIDADPDANLAATLGFPNPESIVPISDMKDLVEERTGTGGGKPTPYFKLNPKVDDIPEKYAVKYNGLRLMRMGRVKQGGSGCYCGENTLVRSLLAHLLLASNEVIILDTAAGIEHLSRGTAKAVDKLIIVVEPGRRSIETAREISKLAQDIGITNIAIAGNKVRSEAEKEYITSHLTGYEFLGFIPFDQAIVDADLGSSSVLDASPKVAGEVKHIYQTLLAAQPGDISK